MKTKVIKELLGKTLTSVKGKVGGKEIIFKTTEGKRYKFYHGQDCCESVTVEDICGELQDLVGSPLTTAEESRSLNKNPPDLVKIPQCQDSYTWTFYRFATAKGFVTIRWYGESNGYYSEAVDFVEIKKNRRK